MHGPPCRSPVPDTARGVAGWRRRAPAWSLGLAVILWGTTAGAQADGEVTPLEMQQLADGVYVHSGQQAETEPGNLGDIANLSFVVGERCVAVIDTGGSRRVGEALRAAVRAVTTRPVCAVINTHMHPDHVFGNAAFQAEQPQFVGHAHLGPALAARRGVYESALRRLISEAATGSVIVEPTTPVTDTLEVDLGGRILTLKAWPTAHTDNDLTVFDERSGTLWLGDLVFDGHLPVVDGSLRGWLKVLPELERLPARHRVPGHGRIDLPWPQGVQAQRAYLEEVAATVRKAIAANQTLGRLIQAAPPPSENQWLLMDAFHLRNLSAAYAELEWE